MKKQVHFLEMEDMKKYIEGFNPDDYEITIHQTDPSVTEYARDYYDNHLPVDVTAWIRVHQPDKYVFNSQYRAKQVFFVRDKLACLLRPDHKEWRDNPPMVISTYIVKLVRLPVFQINLKRYGAEIVLRYNFRDWKVSVKSDKPLDFDHMELFDPTKEISGVHCEGFPKDKVYGCYEKNHCRFTVEIESHYDLYAFIVVIKNCLGIKKEE